MTEKTVVPFIIWTVQRTGGTNFATNLIKLSGLPIIEHEPLNVGRSYGHIATEWEKNGNKLLLSESISELLDKGYAIKHCVETVDWEVTEELILGSLKRQLNHIILYRSNAIDRLLSLHFATETGLWGRKKVDAAKKNMGRKFSDANSIKKIDADQLISHETYCNKCLMRVARLINDSGSNIHALSFEEIYEGSVEDTEQKISTILKSLGIASDIGDFLQQIRRSGDQGSKSVYINVNGYDELRKNIKNIRGIDVMIHDEFKK